MRAETAQRRPSQDIPRHSHGLWSLWDMHEFRIKPLIDAMDVLVNCSAMIHSEHPKIHPKVSDKSRTQIAEYVEKLVATFTAPEFEMCRKGAERLLRTLQESNLSHKIVVDVDDLRKRLLDQGDMTFCLLLSPQEKLLFDQPGPLGADVETKFPSANDDIYEACKCLALGRSTACVMHLMRVCEVGLKSLAATIDVRPQGDWGAYLREIENELERRAKAAGKRTIDEQFYSEAAVAFGHLKRAWRNPSMHVEKTYTPERAEKILEAVRSFMSHLATKISEPPLNEQLS